MRRLLIYDISSAREGAWLKTLSSRGQTNDAVRDDSSPLYW